ncbi:helix-turn-helix transcriptional regulator [Fluviicola taffensis]|uniref:response regulator transcription factor n=1 Tax=Fluviicola taffensis TaxID=191579 RepID=UPI0031383418
MKNKQPSTLLTKNKVGVVSEKDTLQQTNYLEAVKSFARLTYESVYVIDYETMSFEYVSENPLFLCGYSSEEVLKMGYDFYFKHVPEEELNLLEQINEAGFDFFEKLPADTKKEYSITYDFHLTNQNGKNTLINHKLTPLFLTDDSKIWKAVSIVSLAHHQHPGNVFIKRQGSKEQWELDLKNNIWRKSLKPTLSEREIEVLRLHAQGLTINQIAEKIFVSPDTVKYYRRRIFERLSVNNIVEALAAAVNSKII